MSADKLVEKPLMSSFQQASCWDASAAGILVGRAGAGVRACQTFPDRYDSYIAMREIGLFSRTVFRFPFHRQVRLFGWTM
jgi:hypothetical protein